MRSNTVTGGRMVVSRRHKKNVHKIDSYLNSKQNGCSGYVIKTVYAKNRIEFDRRITA